MVLSGVEEGCLVGGRQSAASVMLTDLYQLTMAQAYLSSGMAETEGCFHLFFRENPFDSGFSVACGLESAIEWLEAWHFEGADLDYLAGQTGNDGLPLFHKTFLDWLSEVRFVADLDAVPEGTVVFPREPLLRVIAPLPICQIAETGLLNIINFQTLVATKAARCRLAARNDVLLEFGLRRAQGPDGGLSASRAAYVGGCDATSNVLAGAEYGIPIAGTHAHSWVMAFDTEIESFEAYAAAMPNNVTFLVDTYDTLEGVRRAIDVATRLGLRGRRFAGVRIDSGDLAWLSVQVRRLLDEAGFTETLIVASNELDEHLIDSLKDQGARIDVWGVGTKLVTGWGQPALGGVYKLSAVRRSGGEWVSRVKVTEQIAKATAPGVQGVRRYRRADGTLAGDMVYDLMHPPGDAPTMVDPADAARRKTFTADQPHAELLVPVFRAGSRVYDPPPLPSVRAHALASVAELDPSLKRFLNPHIYPVGLERGLHDLRAALVMRSRGISPQDAQPSAEALAQADAVVRTMSQKGP